MENIVRIQFSDIRAYFIRFSTHIQKKYRWFQRKYPEVQLQKILAAGLVVVALLIFILPATHSRFLAPSPTPMACTMESKVCPDGTTVGRVGLECKFDVCPKGPPETLYGDPQKRFAFRYDSTLELDDSKTATKSGVAQVFYLSTAGEEFQKNPDDYQIEVTISDTKIPTVEKLQTIDKNSQEGKFLDEQNVEIFEDKMQMKRTYKGDWAIYKKYILYTPNLVVTLRGTGTKHDLLDRAVRSLRIRTL